MRQSRRNFVGFSLLMVYNAPSNCFAEKSAEDPKSKRNLDDEDASKRCVDSKQCDARALPEKSKRP